MDLRWFGFGGFTISIANLIQALGLVVSPIQLRGREKRAGGEKKERENEGEEGGRRGLGERTKRESEGEKGWAKGKRERVENGEDLRERERERMIGRERERLREWEREREITDKIGLHYLRQCHWYALCSCCNAVVHSNIFPGSSRAFVRPQEGAL